MTELVAGWSGKAFVPLRRYEAQCDREFVVGERYILDIGQRQSATKRAMFHATLKDVYANLPDSVASQFVNERHFRYWLEIKAGFANVDDIPCKSQAEAERLVLAAKRLAPYSVVERKDGVVRVWTARSTKQTAMGGSEFSALVDAVLPLAAEMVGLKVDDLRREREGQRHKLQDDAR